MLTWLSGIGDIPFHPPTIQNLLDLNLGSSLNLIKLVLGMSKHASLRDNFSNIEDLRDIPKSLNNFEVFNYCAKL